MVQLALIVGSLMLCGPSTARRPPELAFIEQRLEEYPDSWRLLEQTHRKFHLMFVSKTDFDVLNNKCLTISKIESLKESKWEKKVTYYTFPNKTQTKFSCLKVGIKRSDEHCVFENQLTATNAKDERKTEWKSQIVYTDYKHCILMWSKVLGYSVWAETKYLRDNDEIPYLCVLLFELLSGIAKRWVYDWQYCPGRTTTLLSEA
uniref:Putative conserved secreted protein n=1 Tax=Amblyomma tuberculatum TaxID=48802 RepID=A0A6M2E4X9_9ACAR